MKQLLTAHDRVKYPFIEMSAEHVRGIGLDINDLESDFFIPFLDRAEKRVESALFKEFSKFEIKPLIFTNEREKEIEIFSFPISVMLVAATEDSFIKNRYALSEAKRASELLQEEDKQKLLEIARAFKWDVKLLENEYPYVITVRFQRFLKNSTGFHDTSWKLVNQKMLDGNIFLTKKKFSRLLEEEIRKYVEGRLDTKIKSLPPSIMVRVKRLKKKALDKQEQIRLEEMPERVEMEAFPSCVNDVYNRVAAGRPASHMGRFALTSFMLSIGMTSDDVFKFFRSVSDFNERMTRYQIEHIAGTRGSGTKYTPPNCNTLRTHGICISPEPECKGAVNPLVCYKKKLKALPEEKSPKDKKSNK